MKLRFTTILLCVVAILLLLTPCSSLRINVISSNEQGLGLGEKGVHKIVSRKLRFNEEVSARESANHHIASVKTKEREKQLGKEEEEIDPWQYLSMDYPKRRRRRPVHNKSIPLP